MQGCAFGGCNRARIIWGIRATCVGKGKETMNPEIHLVISQPTHENISRPSCSTRLWLKRRISGCTSKDVYDLSGPQNTHIMFHCQLQNFFKGVERVLTPNRIPFQIANMVIRCKHNSYGIVRDFESLVSTMFSDLCNLVIKSLTRSLDAWKGRSIFVLRVRHLERTRAF